MKKPYNEKVFHTFSARLLDDDMETRFCEDQLKTDIGQATGFMTLAIIPVALALILNAIQYATASTRQVDLESKLLITATIVIAITIFAVALNFYKNLKAFHSILFVYISVLGMLTIATQLVQPADFVGTIYLLYIFHNTLCIPAPIRIQMLPTLIFSAIMIFILLTFKHPTYPREASNAVIAIVTFTIVGYITSRALGRYRRLNYLHLVTEQEARANLEETLDKIGRLTGIVPICSHCKSIRDKDGEWYPTETYIEKHSQAEFSKGICPDCVDKGTSEPRS